MYSYRQTGIGNQNIRPNDGTAKSVGANVNNAEAVSTAGSAAIPVNAALSERQSG